MDKEIIVVYIHLYTYYSVLKKGDPLICKKKKDETGGCYAKEHKPDKDRKKYCIILSVEFSTSLLLL